MGEGGQGWLHDRGQGVRNEECEGTAYPGHVGLAAPVHPCFLSGDVLQGSAQRRKESRPIHTRANMVRMLGMLVEAV